jgi:hypothetical protein
MHLVYTLRNQCILSPKRKKQQKRNGKEVVDETAVGTHGDVAADGGELLLGLAGDGEAAELGERLLHPVPKPTRRPLTHLAERTVAGGGWASSASAPRRGVGCRSRGDSDTEPGSRLQQTTR